MIHSKFRIALVILMIFQGATSAQECAVMPQEPRNINEFAHMLNSLLESQAFIYVIGYQPVLIFDIERFDGDCKHSIKINTTICATPVGAKTRFRASLFPQRYDIPADAVAGMNMTYSNLPKNFFFSKHSETNDTIGNFSFDRKFGMWENDPTNYISFIRGNCVITVLSPQIGFRYGPDKTSLELVTTPDPREIAWKIDQYLKGDPLKDVNELDKTKLKTLSVSLPSNADFEQGKEYAIVFPRKLSNGEYPTEIRLVVSRGEVQQVLTGVEAKGVSDPKVFPNPASQSPDIEGKYTVTFGKSGLQTLHCYHLDKTGKCLAWGVVEVDVKEPSTEKKK